ncbi:M48 family metalloprotease [Chitinophagaceae bacterium MMS25-I14]
MKITRVPLIAMMLSVAVFQGKAQLKLNSRAVKAVGKSVSAAAYSDADAARDAHEAVEWMDKHNTVAGSKDPYTVRLNKIFGKHQNEDGLKLNYKVYKVVDINAFACADGSVRVFSSLMDRLTDDELLAVIGHEIGHVKNHDSRDAMRSALLRSASADALSSQSGAVATLTDSQLGDLAEAIMSNSHSRKQESEADDYSYEFLKKHNYSVMGAYTAFIKFVKLEQEFGADKQSSYAKMMNSHPDSQKRADAIERKAKKDNLWVDPATIAQQEEKKTTKKPTKK